MWFVWISIPPDCVWFYLVLPSFAVVLRRQQVLVRDSGVGDGGGRAGAGGAAGDADAADAGAALPSRRRRQTLRRRRRQPLPVRRLPGPPTFFLPTFFLFFTELCVSTR